MPPTPTPTGAVEISDPNNVAELIINGPFNVLNMGAMLQITFTTVRPDISEILKGSTAPKFYGVVAARLVMPREIAQGLIKALTESLASSAMLPIEPMGRA
jgi:hypothetical protein